MQHGILVPPKLALFNIYLHDNINIDTQITCNPTITFKHQRRKYKNIDAFMLLFPLLQTYNLLVHKKIGINVVSRCIYIYIVTHGTQTPL